MTAQSDAEVLSRSGTRNKLEEALRTDKKFNRKDANQQQFPLPGDADPLSRKRTTTTKRASAQADQARLGIQCCLTMAEEVDLLLNSAEEDVPEPIVQDDDSDFGATVQDAEALKRQQTLFKDYLEAWKKRGGEMPKGDDDPAIAPEALDEPGRFSEANPPLMKKKKSQVGLGTWDGNTKDGLLFEKQARTILFDQEHEDSFMATYLKAMGEEVGGEEDGDEAAAGEDGTGPCWDFCPGPVLDEPLEESNWLTSLSQHKTSKSYKPPQLPLGDRAHTRRQALRRLTAWFAPYTRPTKRELEEMNKDKNKGKQVVEDSEDEEAPARPADYQSALERVGYDGIGSGRKFDAWWKVACEKSFECGNWGEFTQWIETDTDFPVIIQGKGTFRSKDIKAAMRPEDIAKSKTSIARFLAAKKVAHEELEAVAQGLPQPKSAKADANVESSPTEATWEVLVDQKGLRRARARAKKNNVIVPFFKAMLAAAKEIVALSTSDAKPPKRAPREAGKELHDLLAAKDKRELLADAMAAAPAVAYRSLESLKYDFSAQPNVGPLVWSTVLAVQSGAFSRDEGVKTRVTGDAEYEVADYFGQRVTPFHKGKKKWTMPSARWVDAKVKFLDRVIAKPKAYLDPNSESYDISINEDLRWKVEKSCRQLCNPKRTFETAADGWAKWEAVLRSEAGKSKAPQVARDTTAALTANNAATEVIKAEDGTEVQTVLGVRLRDLQDLVERNRSWFEEKRWCKFSQKMRTKTMYDVCPELIIPATTCMERIITLTEEDIPKLKSFVYGGVLASESDLTLKDNCKLGGQDLPAGLTMHGKLVRGGPIRQRYWQQGNDRYLAWRTMECHGREQLPLKDVAPIPKELQNPLDSPRAEPLGEASDRVWSTAELAVGDTVVLRKGVSYIQMCARDGPGFPLDSFASHFWGEETLDFVRTLEKHASSLVAAGEVASDRVYYVCTFNNNQHRVELGSSWKTSPFNRALQYVATMSKQDSQRSRDAVMVFDSDAKPLQRKWCVFEAWRCTELELPLRLFCPDGEITRNSTSATAKLVLQMVQEIDLETAQCSVKSDAVMIDRAIEDAKGGFAAVHAKLRTRVLDLMTFIGSLAVSVDQVTGKKVEEIELKVRGCAPPSVNGTMMHTNDIAREMCKPDGGTLGRNVLLVAPAGSGKSVFSRALVRYAVSLGKEAGGSEVLPVRVPVAELAKIVKRNKLDVKLEVKQLASLRDDNVINQAQYNLRHADVDKNYAKELDNLFDVWAKQSFLRDSDAVTKEGPKSLLLILDGFDEAAEARAEIITWLRSYLQRRKRIMTLLTTRPTGLDGVAMSSGKVRQRCTGKVTHVDMEENQLVLSGLDVTVGTYIRLDGLEPAKECIILGHEQRMPVAALKKNPLVLVHDGSGRGGSRARDAITTDLDQVLCLKPGVYENLDLIQTPPRLGMGAKVTVEVLEESEVRKQIQQKKTVNELSSDYSMTAADIVKVKVLQAGHGYLLDTDARVCAGKVPLIMSAEQAQEFTKLLADDADLEALKIPEGMHKAAAVWKLTSDDKIPEGKSKKETLKKFKDRLSLFTRRMQQFVDKTAHEPHKWDFHFEVKELITYSTLTRTLGKEDERIDLRSSGTVQVDSRYTEIDIRDELRSELGFCDFEIDTIDKVAASAIIRNIGGQALAKFNAETLGNFQQDLWDRPLMANLFGQYLESKGLQFASNLAASVAELYVLRYITQKLIGQAAVVVAPTSKENVIKAMNTTITKGLRTVCRAKINLGLRLFMKTNLGGDLKLWEDAVRGHLRLFEPQQGGKAVQFYHLRIQELLAAEDWGETDVSLERAASQMVLKTQLVQLGLAPLKFLTQMKLDKQGDREDLSLDFSSITSCSDNLVLKLDNWMPATLSTLVIRLPELVKGRKPQLLPAAQLGTALPRSLKEVELDLSRCKVDENGFDSVSIEWRERFHQLKKMVVQARNCSKICSQSVAMFARNLPRMLKELQLNIATTRIAKMKLGDMFPKFAESLPDLDKLCLDIRGWQVSDDEFVEFGKQLPRSLKYLDLIMRECPISSKGIVNFCSKLPELRTLLFDFRLSLNVSTGGLSDLATNLPQQLEELHLTCNRFIGDEDLKGLSEGLPDRLKSLHFDFRRDQNITDAGITELGRHLPKHLRELNLKFPLCMKLTGAGVQGLCEDLPSNLLDLTVHFDACRGIDNTALTTLGKNLPKQLQGLDVNMSGCKGVTDAGVDALCNLPASMLRLCINISGCDEITAASILQLGSKLPQKLENLSFTCRRCDNMNDQAMEGLMAGLRNSVKQIYLDFTETPAGDRGIVSLANHVTYGLQSLTLLMEKCGEAVTNAGVETLLTKLTMPWKELNLNFRYCFKVTSEALQKCLALKQSGAYSRTMHVNYMDRSIQSVLLASERQLAEEVPPEVVP